MWGYGFVIMDKVALRKKKWHFKNIYSMKYSDTEKSEIINRITEMYDGKEKVNKSGFPKQKEIVNLYIENYSKNVNYHGVSQHTQVKNGPKKYFLLGIIHMKI